MFSMNYLLAKKKRKPKKVTTYKTAANLLFLAGIRYR
jgi:hypothetical protein